MVMVQAPAKVNLFLRVLAQERSGFHQLETLFCRLEFGDTVELGRGIPGGIALDVEGPEIGPPKENLAYRAAEAFLRAAGIREGVKIRLQKRLPMGAGLGGGSSDAGATLLGLATLFRGAVGEEQLLEIAGDLGSDVPFFLSTSPLALAWGRGDRIQTLKPLPRAPVLLALPPVEIPTHWAYACLAEEREGGERKHRPRLFSMNSLSSWGAVAEAAENDFESVIYRKHPSLEGIQRALQGNGALISLMSGSGSALFGVFPSEELAEAARDALERRFPDTRFVLTHTETRVGDLQNTEGVEPKVGH
ncbi:MAG: 4-(cytidine 5'-diphospho)-2-C-methyl-D-erythritol kinase [Gemmatimonadota bacterium]|jgi:4-diphosphocytidyl-2-C-methyl-D-erythritol kinase